MGIPNDERTKLIIQASQLTQEEQFCLTGYMYAVASGCMLELDARILTYKLSRTKKKLNTENEQTIRRLTNQFFQYDKTKAFLKLYEIEKEKEEAKRVEAILSSNTDMTSVNLDDEEGTANKLYGELEQLKAGADADTMIKLVNAQQNILHKNKDNFKEDTKQVRYYLPLRCCDCRLYKEAEKDQ